MSHPVFICPDTLLNHTELSLSQLFVNVDGFRLNNVLWWNPDGSPGGHILLSQQELILHLLFSTQKLPEQGGSQVKYLNKEEKRNSIKNTLHLVLFFKNTDKIFFFWIYHFRRKRGVIFFFISKILPYFAGIVSRAIFVEVCFESSCLGFRHTNVSKIVVGDKLELANIVHLNMMSYIIDIR